MLVGYLNGGNPGSGLKLFRKMACMGIRGNDTTMVTVLTACGRSTRWREGRSIHGFIIRTLVNLNLIIDTALIDMYSKCKRSDVAWIFFDRMPIKNLVCWNAMILGHCIHGNPEDGLSLYSKVVSKTRPEVREVDFNKESSLLAGLLGSCRFKRGVMLGERIAKALIEENPGNDLSHAFLLNIYAVAGCWEDVARMKDLIKERGVRRVPGCSLADLKEIVHNLKVGEEWKQEIKEQLVS
ncbi:hypothetical protein RJ639_031033 [Escallonia herrerae]|uniref:Pentatricopeptide repeat-containing protein n=1 Tax=Escallonia herrerae TaxID=1293975 RepID=A0AA88WZJ9_9ASTE|nr:hypothetical protein RJ639_031033 [Escallonia herrerae]